MAVKVVVIGRNYTSRLGMIRAAGTAGYDVIVVKMDNPANPERFDEKSKYVQKYYTVREKNDEELLNVLRELPQEDQIILIPTDDHAEMVLDRYKEELSGRFLFPGLLNKEESVLHYMEKYEQKKMAQQVGLLTAKGWKISFTEDGFQIPEDMTFPCFIKPEQSVFGKKRDMKKCNSRTELKEHLSLIAADHTPGTQAGDILAEEFIDIDKEYDLPGFTDGENVILPFFIEKGLIYSGVTGTGTLLDVSKFQDTYEKLQDFVRLFHFHGLIDIECYEHAGKMYFNEMNLRFGASGYAATGYGINLPEMLIRSLLGEEGKTEILRPVEEKHFASEKVCFQKYISGGISWQEYKEIIRDADYTFVGNEQDPGPYKELAKYMMKRRLKNTVKKIIRRDNKTVRKTPQLNTPKVNKVWNTGQKVVVLGKNYSTPLGVIRSLGKAGYSVDALMIMRDPKGIEIIQSSVYLNNLLLSDARNDGEIVEKLIHQYTDAPEKPVLFPTDDYTSSLIDRYREELADRFVLPYSSEYTITQLMDKSFQSEIARKCGLNTAREWIISLNQDPVDIPADMVYPCFVKPLLSAKGGKSELGRCNSEKELKNKLKKMQVRLRTRSVMIQEFLNITQEYTIGGVCNDQEVYLPAIIKKSRVARHNRGVTLSGTVIDTAEISEDLEKITAFLKAVHYTGMFDLEVHRTDRGLFFGELNLRAGGPSYSYYRCGINLPDLAVKAMTGQGLSVDEANVHLNQTFVNNKVLWEDYADNYLSDKDVKEILDFADFTLLSDDNDAVPEESFRKNNIPEYRKKHVKKIVKSFVKPVLRLVKR